MLPGKLMQRRARAPNIRGAIRAITTAIRAGWHAYPWLASHALARRGSPTRRYRHIAGSPRSAGPHDRLGTYPVARWAARERRRRRTETRPSPRGGWSPKLNPRESPARSLPGQCADALPSRSKPALRGRVFAMSPEWGELTIPGCCYAGEIHQDSAGVSPAVIRSPRPAASAAAATCSPAWCLPLRNRAGRCPHELRTRPATARNPVDDAKHPGNPARTASRWRRPVCLA